MVTLSTSPLQLSTQPEAGEKLKEYVIGSSTKTKICLPKCSSIYENNNFADPIYAE